MLRFRRTLFAVCVGMTGATLLISGAVGSAPSMEPRTIPGELSDSSRYTCNIDIKGDRHNCVGRVEATSTVRGEWVLAVDMGEDRFRRLDIYAEVCMARDWVLHLADSPTANGFGGDSQTSDHDAEAYVYNGSDFGFDSTGDYTRHEHQSRMRLPRLLGPSRHGCRVVHMAALHPREHKTSRLEFDATDASSLIIGSIHGLKLGYEACASPTDPGRSVDCDWADREQRDQYQWHVGLNRTVGSSARNGSGVVRACVSLSRDADSESANCLQSLALR
ncbi:MAG: hypothetical protein MJE77_03515 [Proteobacteria bacterium]|nr:hypothetical protein [Pseudomonadota bacterium]